MCIVSLIMDHYTEKWWQRIPDSVTVPNTILQWPPQKPAIPQEDIDEFYKLLERAREYDRKNNQPDCELDSKKDTLKKLAEQLGVEITFPA